MRIIGNDPSTPRQAQIVASGTLSTGDAVVVNTDGTVSVVAETAIPQAVGSPVVFDSGSTSGMSATYDSNSGKIVFSYLDGGNNSYATAVVGTVSGTSISFGTPVVIRSSTQDVAGNVIFDSNVNRVIFSYGGFGVQGFADSAQVSGTTLTNITGTNWNFNNGNTYDLNAVFDSGSNKSVFIYRDNSNSNQGTAIVASLASNGDFSFGSEVIFDSSTTTQISSAFDSASGKVVIAYKDGGNLDYGTAVVGTVSGTSISFGSPAVFESDSISVTSTVFDSGSNKVVVAYGRGDFGKAVVGTVTGTSISFGTPVNFSTQEQFYIGNTFDPSAGKVVIAFRDQATDGSGTAIVGTVSGTSISFGSPLVFESASTLYISSTFDSTSNKVVIAYYEGAAIEGTSVVFQSPGVEINLTANNYIGTAASGAADTQRAKINLKGAVDENQSGLTAGQSYYVQTDGTLGTTPADPSVFAGTAVAANKLIVKG